MTDKYIRQLISNGENISIEYKSCTDAISASVYETVCSFLNRDGGVNFGGANDGGVNNGGYYSNIENNN